MMQKILPFCLATLLAVMVLVQSGCDNRSMSDSTLSVTAYPNSVLDPEHGMPSVLERAYIGEIYEFQTPDQPDQILAFYDQTYGTPVQDYQQGKDEFTRVYQRGEQTISVNLNPGPEGTRIYLSAR